MLRHYFSLHHRAASGRRCARLLVAAMLGLATLTAEATVIFQDTGTKTGWSNYPQQPQHNGEINVVSSPVYNGTTAIQARQIFEGNTGERYHAEVVKSFIQNNGTDRYYGQAIYVPANWQFHSQNVTFQQWAPDNNAGPWILMFIEGTKLRYAKVRGTGTGIWDAGFDVSSFRGRWVRIVTRINMSTSGIFEVWVNGVKVSSRTGDWSTGWASNSSIRWSSGIYCTGWYEHQPTGQHDLSIYHDHHRVTTTYAEAEPANWGTTFSGNYRIIARHSGSAVVVEGASTVDGADVIQWAYGGSSRNDEWQIASVGGGYYRINNRHSGKALVVQGASTADGGDVIQWSYGGAYTNDEWAIESLGGGYYRFVNRHSGKVLDVAGRSTANGANVQQWSWGGGTNQQFQIISVP